MRLAYIGIGSNLDDPVQQIRSALQALESLPESRLVKVSSCYSSTPMGPQDQPDYANAVAALETRLDCRTLLSKLQQSEQQHGRQRKAERWGPRTLDLDIILYGNDVINEPDLIVPHYGCRQREFVIYPLAEIAPDLVFPDGVAISTVKSRLPLNGLQLVCGLD